MISEDNKFSIFMDNRESMGRRSIRLPKYDYAQDGAYFVTICSKDRLPYFETYPKLKKIIEKQWRNIPNRFVNISLDEYVIMPNHMHGIIIVGATLAVAQIKNLRRAGARPAPTKSITLGEIIGTFKSLTHREWMKIHNDHEIDAPAKFWQRNYYEHIIRNDHDLYQCRKYITENPAKWKLDPE